MSKITQNLIYCRNIIRKCIVPFAALAKGSWCLYFGLFARAWRSRYQGKVMKRGKVANCDDPCRGICEALVSNLKRCKLSNSTVSMVSQAARACDV